jgi:hypothetical protein
MKDYLSDDIRMQLEMQVERDRKKHPAWLFSGPTEFLLAHGRVFERGTPPPRRGKWRHAVKQCFRNAFLNVQRDPLRYIYCEGFCWRDVPGQFEHAWFIDRQMPHLAIDTTLGWSEEYCYFGAPISWEYVSQVMVDNAAYGAVLGWDLQAGHPIFTGAHASEKVLARI